MSNELKPLHFDADYTMEEALAEAKRCLNCPKPLCRMGCPIENEIPRFIQAIARGNFGEANDILAERTNLPSICGRVCPRENQCEGNCIMNKAKKPPINIGKLERFAADFESINELRKPKKIKQDLGKVAVVGSGPAGLSVAGDVAKLGYEVTVFEGQSEPGGVLLFGIPEFRLSKAVVRREIARLEGLGVKFVCNTFIGQDKTLDDLFAEGYDSIFIGTGTHIPQDVRMENDEVPGVFQAMYLLTNVQLVENGELDENQIPVKKGDFFFVPSGTMHAIGAGILVLETQQSSDTTYRVYDFDRKDDQGNLRELHLEKSIDVLNIGEPANSRPVTTKVDDLKSTLLVASDFFAVYKWEISGKADFEKTADYSLFSVLDGQGSLLVDGQEYPIAKGSHFILPSDVQAWEIKGELELIVSHP